MLANIFMYIQFITLEELSINNLHKKSIEDLDMSDEEKKIPEDLKKELLKKTSDDGFHSLEDAKAKLEGKIPTKPKEE